MSRAAALLGLLWGVPVLLQLLCRVGGCAWAAARQCARGQGHRARQRDWRRPSEDGAHGGEDEVPLKGGADEPRPGTPPGFTLPSAYPALSSYPVVVGLAAC